MAYVVEKTGKTVEDAVRLALEELACGRDEAEIEVVAEPAKGLWGLLGSRDAKVRVWKRESTAPDVGRAEGGVEENLRQANTEPEAADESGTGGFESGQSTQRVSSSVPGAEDNTAKFIMDVTALMGIETSIGKIDSEESTMYSLNGPRMGAIIGRRGETLDALQYLTNIVAGRDKTQPRKRIVVDAEKYRQRREDTLIRLATRLAAKAKKSGRRVVLEPMNPQERRVIHTALEKDPDVKSISEGEDPYRRLVIYPIDSDGPDDRYSRWDDED